jgi:hypothetical protein
MSIQAEPDVPLEHFCVDGFYTVKQEELRDEELSRMLESGTSGEVDPKVTIACVEIIILIIFETTVSSIFH